MPLYETPDTVTWPETHYVFIEKIGPFQNEKAPGGKYTRFILTGPFSQLPEVTGRVFKIVAEKKFPLRNGFNIEHYVNDPRTTPEDQLTTEIMFPTA